MQHLVLGLGDHYDVKMPCHLILAKLAARAPDAVLAVLDDVVDALEKTVGTTFLLSGFRTSAIRVILAIPSAPHMPSVPWALLGDVVDALEKTIAIHSACFVSLIFVCLFHSILHSPFFSILSSIPYLK